MVKNVIVNLSPADATGALDTFALSVAETFDAHLSAVAFQYWFDVPGTILGASALAAVIDEQWDETKKAAQAALARFDKSAAKAGVSVDSRSPEASTGAAPGIFSEMARSYDLAVLRQPESDQPGLDEIIAERTLFGSGRPVLMMPFIHKGALKLDHVTVCWDGSRAAARVLGDAMPFLRKSKKIEVFMVQPREDKRREIAGADVAQHLARHGLEVELVRTVAPEIQVGDAILSHVADNSSDMLVMGGYGHSRLREFVLGGVTRRVMESMTVPTLMSH
jgi:nucleotide-binding universal stress UspA family protein